ncbi:MAG: apolipoprotein N-acyltransferase [Minicystis sp.]
MSEANEGTEEGEPQEAVSVPEAKAPAKKKGKRSKAEKPVDPFGPSPTALPAMIAYPLAILCGFLYFLAFPGVDLWPLSFVALVPLIIALRGQSPRRALGLGWLAGFTMTMTGFYWLMEMLKSFSGFPVPLCLLFMAILCGYQAGRIALCGWLYARAERRGWPPAPVFAAAFVVSELVFPLLFPWYYGATVHNAPVLMQTADLGGPYLVGLVLCAVNLAIAELFLHFFQRREKRDLDRRLLLVGAGTLAFALVYGALRVRDVDARAATAERVKVGIIQANQSLFHRNNGLQIHVERTKELKKQGVDLVVWSEGGSATVQRESDHEIETQKRLLTKTLGVPTVAGTLLMKPAKPQNILFNTALMLDAQGAVVGRYDKEYLLAFGEYIPFGDTFPILYQWSPNSSRFSQGTSFEPFPLGDHKISALICYEDILPGFVNRMVRHADPDLLVNLTNDAWFGDSTEPLIHFALAKLRAVEHHRYLVRATNSGLSGIIDPLGRTILRGKTFTEESLIGEARYLRGTTGYEIVGDYAWYLLTLGMVWMAFRPRFQGGVKPAATVPAS